MTPKRPKTISGLFVGLFIVFKLFNFNLFADEAAKTGDNKKPVLVVNLEKCLKIALEKNLQRRVSQYAVEIANAQHKQALSSYWPQMKGTILANRMDEDPNFIFPEETKTYTVDMGSGPIPARVTVPEKEVKLMDRDSIIYSFNLTYPIFTGGKRAAIITQSEIGIKSAKESTRRTDLQVTYDVKRM